MRRFVSQRSAGVIALHSVTSFFVVQSVGAAQRRVFSSSNVRRDLQSPALEAAKRLVRPSVEHPATGDAQDISSPTDACVEWREYWSHDHELPYYHNLKSSEVTWDVPAGFRTRFPQHHKLNPNLYVDEEGRVLPPLTAEERAATPAADAGALSLKKKLALYGSGGLLLYLIIHNICLTCVFVSIYVLEWDLVGLAQSYGFNIKKSHGGETDAAGAAGDAKRKGSFFGTFITAVLLNKMTVPLQIAATLMLAPRFVPLLTPIANRIAPVVAAWWPFGHKAAAQVKIRQAAAVAAAKV